MMLLCLMLSVVGLLVVFPNALVSRILHRLLVEAPARQLSQVTPGRITFWAGFGLVGLILFVLFEADGMRLFSFLAPDLIVWFGMFDVALFLDVFLIAAAMIATSRLRAIRDQTVQAVQRGWRAIVRRVGRTRSRRARPVRPLKPGREDPEPWLGVGVAYAG